MSQEKLTHLPTDEIVTQLVKRFEKRDEYIDYMVMDSESSIFSALPNSLTRNDSEALSNLLIGMGFNLNALRPAYAIFDRIEQAFNIFQIPLVESLKNFATFPRDFSNSTANLTWNRRKDRSELLTVTSLLNDQVVSARYETKVDPAHGDDIFVLTQLDMSETNTATFEKSRYPAMHAGLIPMRMSTNAQSLNVKRVFDIKRQDNPDLRFKPFFIPHVLNPKA